MAQQLERLVTEAGPPLQQASQQLVAEWLRRHGYGLSLELGVPSLAETESNNLIALQTRQGHQVCGPVRFALDHWPICDNSVDLIVLHHCAAPGSGESLFREAVRVLRPEGRLITLGFNAFGYAALRHGLWWERSCLLRGWVHALAQQQDLIWEQTLRGGFGSSSRADAWDRKLPWWLAPLSNLTAELFLKRRSNDNVRPLRFKTSTAVGSPSLGVNRVSSASQARLINKRASNEKEGQADHRRRLQRQSRARRLGRDPEARSA